MRQLILALMIALLPLRGWMGDAMAVETATGSQHAIHSIAGEDAATMEYAHFDSDSGQRDQRDGPSHCPDHASALAGGTDTDTDGDAAAHGQACTLCQVCHTVAMSADAVLLAALPPPVLAPETPFHRFSSALPAPGLKPPIS
jgi:hypothetical protein